MAGTSVSGLEECLVADSCPGELDDVRANEGRGHLGSVDVETWFWI